MTTHEQRPAKAPRTQADRIIAKFGGRGASRRLAAAMGYDPATVYRWRHPVKKGGTGGRIPTAAIDDVKHAARLCGVLLTDEDWSPDIK